MKAILRIPAKEQYGFIEIESEVDSAENAVMAYDDIYKLVHGGFGLPQKEFNACIDRYLTDGTGELDVYTRMSKEQQAVIQEIKKAYKRINKE